MFDFGVGYSELFVLGLIAILVIGPKDLPKVMRMIGQTTRKMKGMAREFQGHVDQAMRESGVDEIKKDIAKAKSEVEKAASPIQSAGQTAVKGPGGASFPSLSQSLNIDNDFSKVFGADAAAGETKVQGHVVEHAPSAVSGKVGA
jgi:sec-independent protein translocase protein TatB